MEKPDRFTKEDGLDNLEVECGVGLVKLITITPTYHDGDVISRVDLTARDCLELADMLRESAHYIMFNKHAQLKK